MKNDNFCPLWIEGREQFSLSKYTSISLPQIDGVSLKKLGYDTAILGSFAKSEECLQKALSTPCFQLLRSQGVRIGIKPVFDIDLITKTHVLSPFDPSFKDWIACEIESLFKALPPFDFFVYESLALIFDEMGLNHDREHLLKEIASAEISLIEEVLKGRTGLVYLFPGEEHSLKEIALNVDSKTWLAFSSRAGNPFLDHLKIHPFLKNADPQEVKGLKLASLVNIGGVLQGGGLWPSVTLDLVQSVYPYLIDLNITPIPCVHGLPQPGSFLEASLIIASKTFKGSRFPEKDLSVWLKETQCREDISTLKEVRDLCVHLSTMRALLGEKNRDSLSKDDTKLLALSVLSRLQRLQGTSLDCLHFFLRDARRIVLHFIQSFNVTLNESMEDAGEKGFWTDFAIGAGSGVRNLGKVTLLKTPQLNPDCPRMQKIYHDAGWV